MEGNTNLNLYIINGGLFQIYYDPIQKYNNYKIEHDIILILMAQILSSEFQTIDYRNPDLNGRKISVIPDVVSEEICRFIMLI